MSVYSMTGYASLQSPPPANPEAAAQARLGIEIRAVNSRFLDLSFKLGDELRAHETALRELISSRIKRGKLEFRAYVIHEHAQSTAASSPSPALLQQLSRVQEHILAWLPQAQPLSVADVLRLSAGQASASEANHSATLLSLAQEAIDQLIASRAREGQRLATMLLDRTSQLRQLVKTALPMVPELVAAQQQRYVQRFQEALQQADANGQLSAQTAQERALTEAASFAIRIDVAEELSRLEAHLGELDDLLKGQGKSGELGKRLDFVIQELHREANTLGSKSSTLALSRISVEMKVLIEQMREQVQNIE
jgi:uncharacterized protein (TIGR00255 family)